MDLIASLRSEAKPQRVDKWRTDFHSLYERSGSSKSLHIDVPSTSRKCEWWNNYLLGIYDREEGLEVFALYVTE
jgi:hypothetical protein